MFLASFRRNAALGVIGTAVAVLFPLSSVVASGTASAAPAPVTAESVKSVSVKQAAKPAKLSKKARKAARAKAAKKRQLLKAKRIIKVAARYKGRPYRWGATGPSSFDCSGYTRYVVRKATGKNLPRTSSQQSRSGKVDRVSRGNRQVGDLVFFGGRNVYHVGIYAGKGTMWHAPKPGSRVKRAGIWTSSVHYGRVV